MHRLIFSCQRSDSSLDLLGTHATGTYINSLMGAVYNSLDLSDVRLPGSAGLSVRVGHIVTENKSLLAVIALCHRFFLLKKSVHMISKVAEQPSHTNFASDIIVTIIPQMF